MKKFHFRLHVVERVRKQKEDEALRLMGEAQRNLQQEINKKNKLLSDLGAALERRERLSEMLQTTVTFQLENEFILGTKLRVQQADLSIDRARRRLERAMKAYIFARQQRRMIDRLREKAFEKHKRENIKQEQKTLNDLNIMRHRMRGDLK